MSALPKFLQTTDWKDAASEPLAGDASARCYFRLRKGGRTAILMDASRLPAVVPPFIRINQHLHQLGFSVPEILARDEPEGLLLLEDFGNETFSGLLERGQRARKFQSPGSADEPSPLLEMLLALGTDVLIALHRHPQAALKDLRVYHPQKMLEDVELFLESHSIPEKGREEFRSRWLEVLPVAHQVPVSLLLRDYHVANLMLLPGREGIRRAGLLDFQDAYQGPVTYDLVSLLEDARRDLPPGLKEKMVARYLAQFPGVDQEAFSTSMAILAALRHTRVLAIFEKLSREGKPDYKKLHSPRVERMLQEALRHPKLAGVKQWFATYAR